MIDFDIDLILDFYFKDICPLTEHGVAVQNSGLMKGQEADLEKVQKVALTIILEDNYISYDVACTLMNILALNLRRIDLCTTFAIKLYKSPRCEEFFTPAVK